MLFRTKIFNKLIILSMPLIVACTTVKPATTVVTKVLTPIEQPTPVNQTVAIQWHDMGHDTLELAQKEHKFILVVFKTDWCQACKTLMNEFSNPELASYINTNFIPVLVNDEDSSKLITFTMAALMSQGKEIPDQFDVVYPTIAVLSYTSPLQVLETKQGLLPPETLRWFLKQAVIAHDEIILKENHP